MVVLNWIGGIVHPSFKLTPHAEEIIGDHEAVYQLFVAFKKAYDSLGREVLYSILIELVSHATSKANKHVSKWNL
jgi:DNA-binding FrmR family transcriptional regulator